MARQSTKLRMQERKVGLEGQGGPASNSRGEYLAPLVVRLPSHRSAALFSSLMPTMPNSYAKGGGGGKALSDAAIGEKCLPLSVMEASGAPCQHSE